MSDDDFDRALGETISDDVDSSSESSESSSDRTRTRDKRQLGMYLADELVEEVDQCYERFNAQRVLDGKSKAEKNSDFHRALIRCALDNDWESYLLEELGEIEDDQDDVDDE